MIKKNNPRIGIGDDDFGLFVCDKSKPIDDVDLLILKSRRFGKPSTFLRLIPYMIAANGLEKMNKNNLDNKSN